jgi:translation initiation factor RLI1
VQVIKRFILHAKKTAFVVEHDFIMATYLADKVIVYDGVPSLDCVARAPQSLLTGMNSFLRVSCISLLWLFLCAFYLGLVCLLCLCVFVSRCSFA